MNKDRSIKFFAILACALCLIGFVVFVSLRVQSQARIRDRFMPVAIEKARELGCPVDKMILTGRVRHGVCVYLFYPKERTKSGGDVEILIDSATGKITDVIKGY